MKFHSGVGGVLVGSQVPDSAYILLGSKRPVPDPAHPLVPDPSPGDDHTKSLWRSLWGAGVLVRKANSFSDLCLGTVLAILASKFHTDMM